MNAASLFREAARAHPGRVAFYEGRHAVTFGALWDRVARKAERFHPGDRSLIMLPMSVELYVALLAVLHANAVAVFIDPWVGTRRMIQLARFSHPDHWVGSWKSQLLRVAVILSRPGRLRRLAKPSARFVNLAGLFEENDICDVIRSAAKDLPARHDEDPSQPAVSAVEGPLRGAEQRDAALITFTTGSSGMPKGVNRTHRILIAQHERLAENFPANEGDVDLCTFPIFALNNLALGVTTLIPPIDLKRIDAADPRKVARMANARGVTTATASPPLFDMLARVDDRPRLRRILTGGAPVTDAQLRAWIAAWPDAEIVVAYGSSEAEPVAHISARERLAAKGRGYLAGRIVNGVRARLDRIDDTVGELLVAGDHVAHVEGDDGEWHRMGDTGWFDEEKRFRIAGRVHSTIWRNGVAVHAQLVEQAAHGDDPRIRRVAALGVEGRVIVVVESVHDVAEDVRKRVDADEVIVTKEPLPVDPRHNSKIDYAKLRAMMMNDEG